MQNGDRYLGSVVAMTSEVLVLRSEVLGTVTLPRNKVAQISLGASPVAGSLRGLLQTNLPTHPPVATTNTLPKLQLPASSKLSASTNVLQQVQEQLLTDATPEARSKFRELAGGYLTGKVTVGDIRAEARSAVAQLKALKAELGEDGDTSLDGYLTILEGFLNETKSADQTGPNTKTKAKSDPALKED